MGLTQKHLEAVGQGKTMKEKRKLAQDYGSVLHPWLIPVEYCRVMLAVLHIILGVPKKLLDNLASALQEHETTSC
jgi:hypothetical protein